jgi:hypothetical protein
MDTIKKKASAKSGAIGFVLGTLTGGGIAGSGEVHLFVEGSDPGKLSGWECHVEGPMLDGIRVCRPVDAPEPAPAAPSEPKQR